MLAPGLILLVGALFVPVLPKALGKLWLPAVSLTVLVALLDLSPGMQWSATFWGREVLFLEVSWLRLFFGVAFALATLLWSVYAWDNADRLERTAGMVYAGSALGVVFAGDWLAFFLFWEAMAVASTLVVLAGRTPASQAAALRYFLVHILGGVLVLSGIVLVREASGSWAVAPVALDGVGPWLLFLGFAVNAAVWPLSAWLPDAYPEASPTGTVLLGTFTTKTAVFALTFVFAGATVLCLLGAVMAAYGVVYALSTRNYRRLLSYSLVGQVGFMLAAAGAGGDLGQSAAAAHALMHVLYKSLLFMAGGAVLLRTGRAEGGGFAGLGRQMPWTFAFALVGAASISALPLTNAFASKSLVLGALETHAGRWPFAALVLLTVASALAPLYVGLRFPWLVFFGREAGVRVPRAPLSMRIAMGATAFLCLALGLVPGLWMHYLPGTETVHVFTWAHVGKQLLLLAIGTLLFLGWRWAVPRLGWPRPHRIPDTDLLWRRGAHDFLAFVTGPFEDAMARMSRIGHEALPALGAWISRNPAGFVRVAMERLRLGLTAFVGTPRAIDRAQARFEDQLAHYRRTSGGAAWPIGRTVLYVSLLLVVYLVVWLIR